MSVHTSSSCPCHPDALVTITYRNGYNSGKPVRAGSMRWTKTGDDWDIAAYFVLRSPDQCESAWKKAGGY